MKKKNIPLEEIYRELIRIISETNGVTISSTLELMRYSHNFTEKEEISALIDEFQELIWLNQQGKTCMKKLLDHPLSKSFFRFFKEFPLPFYEEHTHLTGSLDAEFIFPRLQKLLDGADSELYKKKITEVYGNDALPIKTIEDVAKLITLKPDQKFDSYLRILYLPKLILTNRQSHLEAANHLGKVLYEKYNIGHVRLKFTLSRVNNLPSEQIPGIEKLTAEDVIMGLYNGFKWYQRDNPKFNFTLSPCFRKEPDYFDHRFKSKEEHIDSQVEEILRLIDKYPELKPHLAEVDTVGDEKQLYSKKHFNLFKRGLRKLQYRGFQIRSHHGETWRVLRTGIQSVDNAMNILRIEALEHGLSLGLNPNYYFHRLFQRAMVLNRSGKKIIKNSWIYMELEDMEWTDIHVRDKIFKGIKLTDAEEESFLNTKFHHARDMEQYQHDILNRMIQKKISLVSLPTSNLKLTGSFPDFKHHPFSWWEKKGVDLGVGTDNYITLGTNYIREMLILLYSDPDHLKISKLLTVTTKENRRSYMSHLLWKMRQKYFSGK
ncbi:hypothetical protein KAJ27_05880 [bacterium]|nr:hypothetical protein [bacterium]